MGPLCGSDLRGPSHSRGPREGSPSSKRVLSHPLSPLGVPILCGSPQQPAHNSPSLTPRWDYSTDHPTRTVTRRTRRGAPCCCLSSTVEWLAPTEASGAAAGVPHVCSHDPKQDALPRPRPPQGSAGSILPVPGSAVSLIPRRWRVCIVGGAFALERWPPFFWTRTVYMGACTA